MSIRRFPGQKRNENIEIVLRKHWIVHTKIFLITLLFGLIPGIIYIGLAVGYTHYWGSMYFRLTSAFFMVYLLFVGLIAYIKWLNEELDVVIVTSERILNVNQLSFLNREISEANLFQVQDIKGGHKGIGGNVLEYGDLEVQTAADQILFKMSHIPKPHIAARQILDLRETKDKNTYE